MQTINISEIEKGDYLSPAMLEDITGEIAGTSEYALQVLAFKAELEKALLKENGKRFTLKHEGGGLRVLTDVEASEYNSRQVDLARSKLFRAHRRNLDVDETNLSDVERQTHYRNLEVGSKYVQALRQAKRSLPPLKPNKRQTPGIS